jgi:hypothetical protein
MSTAWNRDATGKTPSDLRDAAVGITGPLWDAYEPRWTISPNIRFRHRTDLYGTQDGNALVMQGNLIILPLVNSAPGKDKFSYVLVPYFGAQAENRQGGGSDEGHWRSSYLGANLNANLNMLMPRLSAAATVQWFRDQFAPANNLRRTKNFSSASLSYALTDPEDKSITVRPALTLQRNVGNDLLSGNGNVNKTVFGLTLQIN